MEVDLLLEEGRGGGGKGWAFSVSTWAHLALVALLVWLPQVHRSVEPPKEEPVEFDVKRQPKLPEAVPFQQAPPRAPVPAAPLAPAAPQRRAEAIPSPATPRSMRPPSDPIARDRAQDGRAISPRRERVVGGNAGRPGEPPPGPGRGDGDTSPRSLESALQDFRLALRAPPPAGGGEKGKGGASGTGFFGLPELPPNGMGIGNLEFEGRDYDWEPYARQIFNPIAAAWCHKLLTMADVFEKWASQRGKWLLDDQNRIRFTIARNGQVTEVQVENSSGCAPFDQSAVDALREVVFPPLPSDFGRDTETIRITFTGNGDVRAIRSGQIYCWGA